MEMEFILYVADQEKSKLFYAKILNKEPVLHVPGMTEFSLGENCILGLMPERGIKRLLGSVLPDPALANGVPRAELYLKVEDPAGYHSRALECGAKPLSGLERRDWGDIVAYVADPDGHIIAFAQKQ